MAAETGFLIDGKVLEVPALDSLTMGERRVMFELSGVTQEDFVRAAAETVEEYEERAAKMIRHPGMVESLMHIALQRENPGMKREKVQLVIEGTTYLDAVSQLVADEEPEEDEAPLALTSEPSESSSSGPLDSENSTPDLNENGGSSSTTDSDRQASTRPDIGTMRSGTSPMSPEAASTT